MGQRKDRDKPTGIPKPNGISTNEVHSAEEPLEKKSKPGNSKHKEDKNLSEKTDRKKEKREKKDRENKRDRKEKKDKKCKEKKKDKKRKLADLEDEDGYGQPEQAIDGPAKNETHFDKEADGDGESLAKKAKLSKKAKWRAARRKRAEVEETASDSDETGDTNEDGEEESDDIEKNNKKEKNRKNKNRFILFIGNLPYSATSEDVEKHFLSFKPMRVRLVSKKPSEDWQEPASKGCAFVEVDDAKRMQACLLKMHHTVLTSSLDGEKRKINVEVSAGGGGSNPHRMEKIREKNAKLTVERAKKAQKHDESEHGKFRDKDKMTTKKHHQKTNAEKDATVASEVAEVENGRNSDEEEEENKPEETAQEDQDHEPKEQEEQHAGMHPSRLARLSAPEEPMPLHTNGRRSGSRLGGGAKGRRKFSRGGKWGGKGRGRAVGGGGGGSGGFGGEFCSGR